MDRRDGSELRESSFEKRVIVDVAHPVASSRSNWTDRRFASRDE